MSVGRFIFVTDYAEPNGEIFTDPFGDLSPGEKGVKKMEKKAYQRAYHSERNAKEGDPNWVEVPIETVPQGVFDAIAAGNPKPQLYWGHWNTNYDCRTGKHELADDLAVEGVWPDWVIVIEDGTRQRVRLISDTTGSCPSGPCGRKDAFVLFTLEMAARANLEGKFIPSPELLHKRRWWAARDRIDAARGATAVETLREAERVASAYFTGQADEAALDVALAAI